MAMLPVLAAARRLVHADGAFMEAITFFVSS
jgi:hypothetical protein